MCDFDLSQALDCSPEEGIESACFDMKEVESEIFRLNEGLELMVSHNRRTMKSVALLVLGVNRMKKPLTQSDRKLSDDDVMNIIDSVVKETVWTPSQGTKRRDFLRANSEKALTLCDNSQKDLVLSGELQLQAITLQGGNCHRKDNKVVLFLEQYHDDILTDRDMDRFLFYRKTTGISLTTFESVKFRGWYISTSQQENQPVELCKVDAASRLTSFRVN
ncbi:interleukin-1 beta-like [Neolamprologus brichardi]|uniref:interleukin-1 beta-like n=1 Tax=Neolamprologus brichardi TaxID=32507 RepID=UPI0003EC2E18|nr:interleukin-1 beta-like [Neolamprologus brichardi]